MDAFVVHPGSPLEGEVAIGGAKNSVLKLMAATLLAEGRHVLRNVPDITDVATMADVLRAMGITVGWSAPHELTIDVPADVEAEAPYELVERMRASVVVLGPLLAHFGRAKVAMPGGDDLGPRPINFHIDGLTAMGATFTSSHGYLEGEAYQLHGARIVLDFPSHTTTDNLMMAAVLAKGTTVIDNAAREPEVADLAAFLNRMGAQVVGAGSSTIEIEGVETLVPVDHAVIPDRVEAATFLAAVGAAGGEIELIGAQIDHMDMLVRKLCEMGMRIAPTASGLWASRPRRLHSVDIASLPYPGVATDYQPFVVTLLTLADGVGIVTENLFSGRWRYIDELRRMGADIRTEGHHAVVRGTARLSGAPVKSPDIRAGAALVLAGLAADGETVVSDAYHLDRGYEAFDAKLRGLGADVHRRSSSANA